MFGNLDSLGQHRGRARTLEKQQEKRRNNQVAEKERSKNPEKHLEAFSASNLKEEGLMPHIY